MLNPEIRDQAYQFFVEEAPELLQIIESGLLTLKEERSKPMVHEIMRAAHSIKGGAASVELDAIKTLAHRLEDIFKALYDDSVVIDTELETLLLEGYDCLRNPLEEQIATGSHDEEGAIAEAEPIWQKIEAQLGESLNNADQYIPSSADLGVDIVSSLFEVDVTQGLEHLATVAATPDDYDVFTELQTQMEVFNGFAEMLGLPGFGEIAQVTLKALELNPDKAAYILPLALGDLIEAREQVLEKGDRTSGGSPSAALVAFTSGTEETKKEQEDALGWDNRNGLSFDNLFEETGTPIEESGWTEIDTLSSRQFSASLSDTTEEVTPDLEDIFGSDISEESSVIDSEITPELEDVFTLDTNEESPVIESEGLPELEDVFTLDTNEESPVIESESLPDLEDVFTLDTNEELPSVGAQGLPSRRRGLRPPLSPDLPTTHQEKTDLEDVFGIVEDKIDENLFTIEGDNKDNPAASLDEVFGVNSDISEETETLPEKVEDTGENTEPLLSDVPSLDEVFGSIINEQVPPVGAQELRPTQPEKTTENLEDTIKEVESVFENLPTLTEQSSAIESSEKLPITNQPSTPQPKESPPTLPQISSNAKTKKQKGQSKTTAKKTSAPSSTLSVKVDFNRLERMNNLVGELVINRNSLSLQNDQMQGSVKALLNRFANFQGMIQKLQDLSDKMLVEPERMDSQRVNSRQLSEMSRVSGNFDSLEMDTYNHLYSLLGMLLEEMIQLEESVDDVVLFARTSNQTLEQQRQMLTNLRDELMWARMLPLGEVLNRFPRLLRDLSANYSKPVRLKLTGTGVLVDKAALEKLYDPLLHLLRNAFDHGIESVEDRQKTGKPEEGQIEIRAYHQGNQTIVEMTDDGCGLNYEKIKEKAIKAGIVTAEQMAVASKERIQNLIFEPGFSTASQVSELSGRGVGLDVVRSQLRALKGTVSVTSKEGQGTTFTLKLPLTLTIAKLLVCTVDYENSNSQVSVALPSDTIEEIIVPEDEQIKMQGNQRFLSWQRQIIPIYPVKDLLKYNCPLPERFADKGFNLKAVEDWGLPLLILRRGQQLYALEVTRLVTEQELVIKPFGNVIAAPSYTYGCTILGDGMLIPVVNGTILIEQFLDPHYGESLVTSDSVSAVESVPTLVTETFEPKVATTQTPLMLVVDDSAALRRTLALTLEKAGYRVVQARDGREALEQLQRTAGINMVLCDVEMPNMNGFEFLGQRRRNPEMMKIPVAMLTSRSSDKHRQLAMTLGASAYFTKPYIEQQFLASIANILEEKGVKVNSEQLAVSSKQ